jgi:hypothetical protein
MLDELGFASLAVAEEKSEVATGVIDDLGGENAPAETQLAERATEGQAPATGGFPNVEGKPRGEGASQPTGQSTAGPLATPTDGEPVTADVTGDEPPSARGEMPAPLPPDLEKQPKSPPDDTGAKNDSTKPGSGQPRDGQRRGQRPTSERDGGRRPSRGGYPVLRSYVSCDNPETEREVDPVAAERRERVNRHGMNRVLEYERQHGRHHREMPHLHPGYDVESDNDYGQLERYIEVKSLSGDWEGPHAGMTDMQFKNNEAIGNRYWLYVVERADQHAFTIWRIQNAAERVISFMFDDGWKNVSKNHEEVGEEDVRSTEDEHGVR